MCCSSLHPLRPLQFEIRQLRAHLAQQDLDLVAEREAAMQIHHMWGKQNSNFQEVDGLTSGASEHHGPPKSREPGAAAGICPQHCSRPQRRPKLLPACGSLVSGS